MPPDDKDDDLIVELEDGPEDFAPSPEEAQVEPHKGPALEAPTLPDEEEGLEEDEPALAARQASKKDDNEDDDSDDGQSDLHARLSAAEEQTRSLNANM